MFVPNVPVQEEAAEFHVVNPRQAATEKILLVEDEAFVREVTCEVLRASGYEVFATQSPVEAMKRYKQANGDIDLLLTDIVLPGESGRVLAGKLMQSNSRLKVLFVTGYAEQLDLRINDGCDYLAKPFSSEELVRRVKNLMNYRFPSVGTEDELGPLAIESRLQNLSWYLGEWDNAGQDV